MKLITHRQRPWNNLLRCGAAAACLSVALAGYAQSSGSGSGSSSGSSTNDRTSGASSYSNTDANRHSDKSAKADQKFVRKLTEANQREMAMAQLGVERATNPQVKAFAQKMVTDHQNMDREFASITSGLGISASSTAMHGSSSSLDNTSGSTTASTSPSTTASTSPSTTGSSSARNGGASPNASSAPEYGSASTSGTGSSSGQTSGMASSAGSSDASNATGATATDEYSRDHTSMSHNGSQDRAVRKLMDEKSGKDFDKAFVKAMVKEHKQAEDLLEDAAKDKDHSEQIRSFANKNLPTIRAHLAEAKQLEKSID